MKTTTHITINGEPYHAYAGMAAIRDFCDICTIPLPLYTQMLATHDFRFSHLITLGWTAIKHGYRIEKKNGNDVGTFDVSLDDFADLIEEEETFLVQVLNLYGLASAVEEPEEEKKIEEVETPNSPRL